VCNITIPHPSLPKCYQPPRANKPSTAPKPSHPSTSPPLTSRAHSSSGEASRSPTSPPRLGPTTMAPATNAAASVIQPAASSATRLPEGCRNSTVPLTLPPPDPDPDPDPEEEEEDNNIPLKSHLYTFPRTKSLCFPCARPYAELAGNRFMASTIGFTFPFPFPVSSERETASIKERHSPKEPNRFNATLERLDWHQYDEV
jgi:hypothetical protein